MNYEIPYVCISHIGRCRHSNQDNFVCDGTYRDLREEELSAAEERPADRVAEGRPETLAPDPHVYSGSLSSERPAMLGVFDGMGGEECGEMASLLAAKEAAGTVPYSDTEGSLLSLCRRANARICCYAEQYGVPSMGTTAAILSFDPREIAVCNIGDSKILRFSDRGTEQLSVDHICAVPYGMKPPLSQNLGIPPAEMQIEPYTGSLEYRCGDVYLICSDGLTDMVPSEEITQALAAASAGIGGDAAAYADSLFVRGRLETAARHLLDLAMANGGRDNITVILCGIIPGIA